MYTNNTNDFYDAIADYYQLFNRDWDARLDREGLGLRSIFRGKNIKRVLDASCGAGAQAIPLAQLDFDVTAIDPSAGMLRKAQEIAADYGVLDHIHFDRADFLSLKDVVTGTFDAVITKGSALPHLLFDSEILAALRTFHDLLRPDGLLVIGMRDFGPFMKDRPRFLPGFVHQAADESEFITFDLWEWLEGPPVIATQKLYIVMGKENNYKTLMRKVIYRPLSTDEVKVALLEAGFTDITDQPDRAERVLVARKP